MEVMTGINLAPDAILKDGDLYKPVSDGLWQRVPSDMWGDMVRDHVAAFGTTWLRPIPYTPPAFRDRLIDHLENQLGDASHDANFAKGHEKRLRADERMWTLSKIIKWVKQQDA